MNEKDKEELTRKYNHEKQIAEKWGCEHLMSFNDWCFMNGYYFEPIDNTSTTFALIR